MLVLNGGRTLQLVNLLYASELALRSKDGEIKGDQFENLVSSGAAEIAELCRNLGLETSAITAENMLPGKIKIQDIHAGVLQLARTFHLEMKDRNFFGPLPAYQHYYDNPKLFGEDVFNRFPVAADDIYEAGCCLAFERPTACVMHLMRVWRLACQP